MSTPATNLRPDLRACAVARAVADAVGAERVIVFGSRARGDHRPDSDIDLLVVTRERPLDKEEYMRAGDAARDKVEEVYGHWVGFDLAHMTADQFHDGRRARNHLAGQAVRDGYDENGAKVVYDNLEPSHWPDIRQRIANARRNLSDLEKLIEAQGSQEGVGFFAQQALENILKGWISALDDEYRNTHDLGDLMRIVRFHPAELDTPAGEQLTWLSEYAVRYRYEGARVEVEDRYELLHGVMETVLTIIDRIGELTGGELTETEDL